jgi:glycerophosphoryl diester phosphodiesterase
MTKIVGHRGASGYAPENTLRSFQYAIDVGCDRTELDVRLSKDNEIIVIHDEEVSRITDGKGMVRDMSLAELKKLNCPDNQKLLTLQEVVDLCKNKIGLQIELKAEGTPQAVNELILENDIENGVVITSFDIGLLREIKRLNPKLKAGLLFREYSDGIWKLVEGIPLDFIGPQYSIVTARLVNKAHESGRVVYAYHVNEKDIGEKLIALGVDEIGSDFPKLFISS